MKKALVVVFTAVFALIFSSVLFASQSNTGCGVGSMIFNGKDGLLSQTCAVSTNGILGNQTFGITTGTLNCTQFSGIVSNEKVNKFVAENMDNLATDISKGNGEYLSTLAALMEVKVPERAKMYNKLQTNFSRIYNSDKVTHIEVLKNIEKVLTSI